MKILQIVPTLGVGGAERMVVHLSGELHRLGDEVIIATLYDRAGSHLEEEATSRGLRHLTLGKRLGFDPRMVRRIVDLVGSLAPDVVHTHIGALRYLTLGLPWLHGRAGFVHTLHNVAEAEAGRLAGVSQRIGFKCGVVPVAIGSEVAASFRRRYGVQPAHVIAHGVPDTGLRSAEGRRVAPAPDGRPTFVCVSRLAPQKNVSGLLRAFSKAEVDANLQVVGDGEERGNLEALARTLRIEDRVRFLGVRSDVLQILANCDGFLLFSNWEGNPIALMEAMMAGRPVIASAVGGVPGIVQHGKTGFLVDASDERAFARAIERLVHDPAKASRMGELARLWARENFGLEAMARNYQEVYRTAARQRQ